MARGIGIILFIGMLAFFHTAHADTLYVPDDYKKIQWAIDASSNGDTILVKPGIYWGNIDFLGKAVIVRSVDGPEDTVIHGEGAGSVVTFENNEGVQTVLDGFTVTKGYATKGGGIYCKKASPSILNNIIKDNTASSSGGGISCVLSSPLIMGNLIHGNTGIMAGGILVHSSSCPVIRDNVIRDNVVTSYGGGIMCDLNGNALIENNVIAWNEGAAHGGGIFVFNSIPLIVNNTVFGNNADEGGGLDCRQMAHAVVWNTVFWNNHADQGKEICVCQINAPSNPAIRFSCVKGGKDSVYVEPGCTLDWGEGMIESDPLFEDPRFNDFHLTWLSPCINRGTNEDAPDHDPDGDARPFMGTADMGADEFTGIHALEADVFTLSESTGGAIHLTLNGGAANAGREYMIFGSVSGTAPGVLLPGGAAILPVNWDAFTTIVANVNYPDSILFTNFYGILDPLGQATVVFDTNGPVPGMAGFLVSFAYPLKGPPWDFASNPINVEVLP